MMRRMMKTLTTLLCAALLGPAACGGKEADRAAAPVEGQPTSAPETSAPDQPPVQDAAAPPSTPEDPPAGSAITPDDCRAAGGVYVPSTGSEPSCPEGKKLIAPVKFGIEGGLCCQQ